MTGRTTGHHNLTRHPVTPAIYAPPRHPFLDSGLRRAATGILPARRIQDVLSINDDEAVDAPRRPVISA